MTPEITMRIELGLQAQNLISQMKVNNIDVTKAIENGLNNAIEEIAKDDGEFMKAIEQTAKQELMQIANCKLISYELQLALQQAIQKRFEGRLDEIAERIIDGVMKFPE